MQRYSHQPTGCWSRVCGLGPDLIGIHSISLAASYRTAPCLNTLSQGLQKTQAVREYDFASVLALSSICEKELLAPSMARSTAEAFNMVCCLDRNGKLDDSPQRSRRLPQPCSATNCNRQDFAGPIFLRASKVLGPISRFPVVEILPHMKLVSRASRPGLTVGFLRILCNGLCSARRFHTEGEEQTCRIGCPDETDSLSIITMNALACTTCLLLFGEQATALPRRSHLLHDLITQLFLRSLQYGIVLMGFIDAFVSCSSSTPPMHRESWKLFVIALKGRIRFVTAITLCLRSRVSGNMPYKTHACSPASELTLTEAPKARYPHLPKVRATTRERGNDFQGWVIYTDGGTRLVNGEALAGWDPIELDLPWKNRSYVWSGHHHRGSSCF